MNKQQARAFNMKNKGRVAEVEGLGEGVWGQDFKLTYDYEAKPKIWITDNRTGERVEYSKDVVSFKEEPSESQAGKGY